MIGGIVFLNFTEVVLRLLDSAIGGFGSTGAGKWGGQSTEY